MDLILKQLVEVESLDAALLVRRQPSRLFPMPMPAFEGQDLSSVWLGLRGASLGQGRNGLVIPDIELKVYTIENGMLLLDHGLDGAILTADGHIIHHTAAFRTDGAIGQSPEISIPFDAVHELDDVFVGFDNAWRNYFHWLCFGLSKSVLGARILGPETAILCPDYAACTVKRGASFGEAAYRQSIEFSGIADRVRFVGPGAYRARRIHFLWTSPAQPTDIMYLDEFPTAFDELSRHASPVPDSPKRIYLARSRNVASRIDDSVADIVDSVLTAHGFERISFEGIDLQRQISMIAHATHVVSPHGAGLSNILFNRSGLKVLELNKPLDGGSNVRPWFVVAAHARGHQYLSLDTSRPDFSASHLEEALRRLGA